MKAHPVVSAVLISVLLFAAVPEASALRAPKPKKGKYLEAEVQHHWSHAQGDIAAACDAFLSYQYSDTCRTYAYMHLDRSRLSGANNIAAFSPFCVA